MTKSITDPLGEPKDLIDHYLKKWDDNEGFTAKENALIKLFHKSYPNNTNIEEVLIKAAALNNFYGTNIYNIYTVAKHITDIPNIDKRLFDGDETLVNEIAKVVVNEKGDIKNFYSFATKYCSHHNAIAFPIYDIYVQKVLNYYKRQSNFEKYTNNELRTYLIFKRVIRNFRESYDLQEYSIKQIDMFLWGLGRDKFPNKY